MLHRLHPIDRMRIERFCCWACAAEHIRDIGVSLPRHRHGQHQVAVGAGSVAERIPVDAVPNAVPNAMAALMDAAIELIEGLRQR